MQWPFFSLHYDSTWEGHRCQFVFVFSHVSSVIFWWRRRILWQRQRILWWRWRIFCEDEGFFTFSLSLPKILHLCHIVNVECLHCILMREAATLSMCRHTNEGIPSTEQVQMLHWACADIIMRGNPLTDMTENTEDANTNWQCLHTYSTYTNLSLYLVMKPHPSLVHMCKHQGVDLPVQ